MANMTNTILNGSMLMIRIGKLNFAYVQSLNFSERMTNAAVGGMGSGSYQTLEPTQYMASGSMTITRYSTQLIKAVAGAGFTKVGNLDKARISAKNDGNSLLDNTQFNPLNLLISSTFDIDVYVKKTLTGGSATANATGYTEELLYTIKNCRLTNYSMAFAPGQLLNETVQYVCLGIEDYAGNPSTKIQGK
jgi:hypothetical protein